MGQSMSEEENQEIKIVISAEGTAAIKTMQDVGKTASDMGKTVEDSHGKATAGIKGLTFAAKGAFHEFGIGGPMARYLGHEAADMAGSLGGAALAFGGVSLAAMAAYKIYEHFSEESKKQREELEKSVALTYEHTKALYANKLETESLIKHKEAMNQIDQRTFQREMPKLIAEHRKELEELEKQQKIGGNTELTWRERLRFSMKSSAADYAEEERAIKDANAALQERIDKKKELIRQEEDQLAESKKGGPSPRQAAALEEEDKAWWKWVGTVIEAGNKAEEEAARAQASIARIIESAQNKREMIGLEGDDRKFAEQAQADQREIDQLNELGATKEQIAKVQAAQEMSWTRMVADFHIRKAKEEEIADRQKWAMAAHSAQAALGFIASASQTMYQAGGKHAREYFEIYKAAAIGQTIMSTFQGAMAAKAAMSVIPVVGPALGEIAYWSTIALGAAAAAQIAQQHMSTGGGISVSGGMTSTSTPSYDAYPGTNIPSGQGGPGTVIINVNHEPAKMIDLATGVVQEVYRNNNSLGGLTVAVERSA